MQTRLGDHTGPDEDAGAHVTSTSRATLAHRWNHARKRQSPVGTVWYGATPGNAYSCCPRRPRFIPYARPCRAKLLVPVPTCHNREYSFTDFTAAATITQHVSAPRGIHLPALYLIQPVVLLVTAAAPPLHGIAPRYDTPRSRPQPATTSKTLRNTHTSSRQVGSRTHTSVPALLLCHTEVRRGVQLWCSRGKR